MEHDRHEIIVQESTTSYGKITIEPLERGYGVTLGNSLRRVLLSSISGAAILAVRVEGVLHEFSTMPGVKEDVIELLVNLKHIPVRCHSNSVRTLHLEVTGPKVGRVSRYWVRRLYRHLSAHPLSLEPGLIPTRSPE